MPLIKSLRIDHQLAVSKGAINKLILKTL